MHANNKWREALNAVSKAFNDGLICTDCWMSQAEMDRLDAIYHQVKDALAAPLRNCDIGTPREQELRMDEWCHNGNRHCRCGDDGCPIYNMQNNCVFDWLQMPCENGGAK